MNYKFYRIKIKYGAEKEIMFSLRPRLLYNQGLISLYFLIVRANSSPLDLSLIHISEPTRPY